MSDCSRASSNNMAQIFISYRRHDSAYLAATLSDKLQQHFGPNSVFFDIDNIPLGVDFREYIGNAVGQCDVLLVIIGDQWMGPTDSNGKRRIDDPSDYVRIEVESALKRNIPVIPVLIEEATMPSPADLPPSLESMSFRNAAEIRAGRDLRQHIEQLIQGLETIIKPTASGATPKNDEPSGPSEAKTPSMEKPRTQGSPAKQSDDSSTLLIEIRQLLKDCTDSYLSLAEAIPAGKLANAISAYAPRVLPGEVLVFLDNTVFGGAKDGLLLTSDAVYWHNIANPPGQIRYADIENVDFLESTNLFTAAKIRVNRDALDVNMGDKNKLAKALVEVIRYLADHVRR